jgi:hypothetical protein
LRFTSRILSSVTSVVAVAAGVTGFVVPASASTASGSATWGKAQQVVTPATRAKSYGGITSVSCAAGGYCAAVGYYQTVAEKWAPYVATGKNGRWSKIALFNLSALKQGVQPSPQSGLVSCPSAGNCVAVGTYQNRDNGTTLFYVNEKNGTWGKAEPIDGVAFGWLDPPFRLACSSAGNCVIGGEYTVFDESESTMQPFVATERNGVWGASEDLPGMASLPNILQGTVSSISCTAGNGCLAVGSYVTGIEGEATQNHWFASTEKNGTWGAAQAIPDLPANASISLAACSPDGSCTITGEFSAGAERGQLFTILRKNGTWGAINDLHGMQALNGYLVSLACPTRGYCTAAGSYDNAADRLQSFVAVERNGYWHKAVNLPGIAKLNHGKGYAAVIASLSCPNEYNCAVTGWANVYVSATVVRTEAFVANEINGVWHWAEVIPNITKLDGTGDSQAVSVSCSSPNHCAAAGFYTKTSSTSPEAFVAWQS